MTAERRESESRPVFHIVLHARLSEAHRLALRDALQWQLQTLGLQPHFAVASSQEPYHRGTGIGTLWILVAGSAWDLFVFDGRNSYVRRIEGADRDAAVVEAVAVIAQRSLMAIVQGEAPQLERVVEPAPPKDKEPEPLTLREPRLPSGFLFGAYGAGTFAPEALFTQGISVGAGVHLGYGLGLIAAGSYWFPLQVESGFGNLRLGRQSVALKLSFTSLLEGFELGARGGIEFEFWSRSATTAVPDVVATSDARHHVWVPTLSVVGAWVPKRSIAPYVAIEAAMPVGSPEFATSDAEPGLLLTPAQFRGSAEVGLFFRFD